MSDKFRVEKWVEDSYGLHAVEVIEHASTEREARSVAARLLARLTLRGAQVRFRGGQGGVVFQFFGQQDKADGWPYVVIITEAAAVAGERQVE